MWINFQRFGDIGRHYMKEKMRSVQVITKPKEPLEKDIEKVISEPGARQVRVNVSYSRRNA